MIGFSQALWCPTRCPSSACLRSEQRTHAGTSFANYNTTPPPPPPFFFFKFIFPKMAQNLDLRCPFAIFIGSQHLWCRGVSTKTRLESRIKKLNRPFHLQAGQRGVQSRHARGVAPRPVPPSQSIPSLPFIKKRCNQHLDLRYVLLSDPSTDRCRVTHSPSQNTSRIQILRSKTY